MAAYVYHASEIAHRQRVVVDCLEQSYANWLASWLFAFVDFLDGASPKLQFSQGCVREDLPSEGSRAFSDILVSSISKR